MMPLPLIFLILAACATDQGKRWVGCFDVMGKPQCYRGDDE